MCRRVLPLHSAEDHLHTCLAFERLLERTQPDEYAARRAEERELDAERGVDEAVPLGPLIQKGTRVLISLWDSLMFGRVPKNAAPFLGTRPNISESHSEISTRVPLCIAGVAVPRGANTGRQAVPACAACSAGEIAGGCVCVLLPAVQGHTRVLPLAQETGK